MDEAKAARLATQIGTGSVFSRGQTTQTLQDQHHDLPTARHVSVLHANSTNNRASKSNTTGSVLWRRLRLKPLPLRPFYHKGLFLSFSLDALGSEQQ